MKVWLYCLLLAAAGGPFLAGFAVGRHHASAAAPAASGGRKVLYYVDPMNPAHTSDKPGLAPCGMKLEPVYVDEGALASPQKDSNSTFPGTVRLSSERAQLIGIRVAKVEEQSTQHHLRLLGKVAAQENRIYRIVASVSGMILETGPFAPGSLVKADDKLAAMLSPEFYGPARSLLSSLAAQDRFNALNKDAAMPMDESGYYGANLQENINNLKYLGMGQRQIQEISHTRRLTGHVDLAAPGDGLILNWSVSPGLRFDRGAELVRMADLSRVWVLADVFANETETLAPGNSAQVILPDHSMAFAAKISELIPQFDGASRTFKVRLEVENSDSVLKPDMFVDVELPAAGAHGLMVPWEAVLDTGRNKTVYIDRGQGRFEPRRVETGRHLGQQVEILRGLSLGDQIVVSGNFLLDSESQMKQAAMSAQPASETHSMHQTVARPSKIKDPVCGMTVEVSAAEAAHPQASYGGTLYYFCSDSCRERFLATPQRFLENSAHPQLTSLNHAHPGTSDNGMASHD
jgi:RND family efflux transporter MFP subunit